MAKSRLVIFTVGEALVIGFFSEISSLIGDTVDAIVDLAKAFPSLLRMADVIARWATSLVGRILAIPWRGFGELFGSAVDEIYGSRLMRPGDAIRFLFRVPTELLQAVTLTDESGIVSVAIGYVARLVYRFVKRFKLLAKLITARDEVEFARVIVQSLKRKGRILFWVFLIVGIFVVEIALAGYVFVVGMTVAIYNGNMEDYLLPQDSKRIWSRKGRQVRTNRRRGPDR